ncbi:histidine kinase dimerization/phospho-acceptor domain-containing protein [Rhodoblastus sp.]|uniref:PAS domain-containing sensor histidine kinase n=1 Tax=Rhodoblastus sp. TaxID=1962975 RepID=UPI0026281121|nr:histidine kinase dimerization/phospho-acceptor domain-containing protein [Rhodoblastus sp.]
MADENAIGRDGGARADVAAALAEPAVASLARAGAPVIVAEGAPPRVIHASAAALALFGAGDAAGLTDPLFAADSPGSRRLAELASNIRPGAAARLERLSLDGASRGAVTFLCRRTTGGNPLFVLAGLGLRAAPGAARPAPTPAASAPAAANLRPAGLETMRVQFAERFANRAPARFLWRADARNVVVALTPPLAEIVGTGCSDLVGRDFLDSARILGLDPRGELAAALRGRVTFSRIDVDWPIEQAGAVAPTTLGGLPVFDRRGAFDGWRGFGVIHLDRLREGPLVCGPFQPATAAPTGQATDELPEHAPPAASSHDFSGVVVPLRPHAGPRPESVAGPRDEGEDDSALIALAPHERSAFREIARALGARGAKGGASEGDGRRGHPAAPASVPPTPTSITAVSGFADTGGENAAPAEAAPLGLIVTRGDEMLYANRLALDWLGYADSAAFAGAGGSRAAFGPPAEDLAPGRKKILQAHEAGGGTFLAEVHRAQLDWNGAPAELITMSRPAAPSPDQRVAELEASLRQREAESEQWRSMLDAAADGVVVLNADGVILGLDRKAEALFDYDRNKVAGENLTLLFARESQVSALDYFTRAKAGVERLGREALGRARQGAMLPLHLSIGRLGKPSDGKYCLILRHLRDWKLTERAMDEARERAERDSQAKSEFLAKVSHEIRTPLNAILGFAEVIMDERFGPVGNERYKDYLRDIHASGAHVLSLVNDLLDLSKIEAGKLELNVTAVDANRVVSECVSLMQPQANREKVITRLALAANLPPVHADERSLRQIVLNLLANAVRYNEPGGQVIVSTALSDSGHAALRIKDTGVGMSESELRTALEPFRQVAPARGGTGLGLPLTKALAEANGAGFSIRSRKNEGTLVEIVLPLAPGAAEAAAAGGPR